MKKIKRNIKIIGASIVFLAVLGSLFVYNYQKLKMQNQSEVGSDFEGIFIYGTDYNITNSQNITFEGNTYTQANLTTNIVKNILNESWVIRIYGNVKREYYIGLSFLENSSLFNYTTRHFYMVNQYGTEWNRDFSGADLEMIFNQTDCLSNDSKSLRFLADDGYSSFELPVRLIVENPGNVLLARKENDVLLKPKTDGGDGPIKSVVSFEIIENDAEITEIYADKGQDVIYNSQYAVKYCSELFIS